MTILTRIMKTMLDIEVKFYDHEYYNAEPLLELIKTSGAYIVTINCGGFASQYNGVVNNGVYLRLAFKTPKELTKFVKSFFIYQEQYDSSYVYSSLRYENDATSAVSDPHRQGEITKEHKLKIQDSINEIYKIYTENGKLTRK